MKQCSITYRSSKIFYRVVGTGRPVIFIHGFGEDGSIWDRQVQFLKSHFRLIIPDLPGSGKSAMLHPKKEVNIEDYAETVKAIIDNESITQCSIAGHSMGGYICLAFAEKYPRLVSSLALVHSSAFADSEEKRSARLKSIRFINTNGAYEFLKTAIPGLFRPPGRSKTKTAMIYGLLKKGKVFSPGTLIQYYKAMIARENKTTVLKNFSGPVLFIIGEHDKAVPFDQSLQQTYLPDLAYIYILRNSAHMGMLEESEKVNTALLAFLDRQLN